MAAAAAGEVALLDETLAKLNGDIGALQAKIKDAKTRQTALVVRGQTAKTRLGIRRQLSEHNIDEAMHRFELYERKLDDLEGMVESYDLGQKTLAAEIEELEDGERIDEELQRLKARVEAPGEPKAEG